MPYALSLALLIAFAACGDASDLETAPLTTNQASLDPEPAQVPPVSAALEDEASDETPAESSPSRMASSRTTNDCRERAVEVASWGYGKPLPAHTFAFASPRDSAACFIPLDQSEDQSASGMYRYTFQIDEGDELRDLFADPAPMASAVIAAVGSEDVNGDGTPDIFIVHQGDVASIAFLSDEEGWTQALLDNGESGVFGSTIDEVIEFWKNPSFPP